LDWYLELLDLLVQSMITPGRSLLGIHTSASSRCLHRSSGNGFKRRTFPFLWFPNCLLSSASLILAEANHHPNSSFHCQNSRFMAIACWPNLLSLKSKLLYDWCSVSEYVLISSTLLGLSTRYYFLSECCCLKFAVVFLTRGRVCNLQCNYSMVRVAQNTQPYFTVSSFHGRCLVTNLRVTICTNRANLS
jgi:hypothetical protein